MTRAEAKTRQLERKLPKVKTKREKVDCKVKKVEDALGLPFSPNAGCTRRGLTAEATGTGSSFSVEPVTSGTAPCTAGEMRAFPAPGEPATAFEATHPAYWLALCVADNTWRAIDLLTLQELEGPEGGTDGICTAPNQCANPSYLCVDETNTARYSCPFGVCNCCGPCNNAPTDPDCCESIGLDPGTSRPRGARALLTTPPSSPEAATASPFVAAASTTRRRRTPRSPRSRRTTSSRRRSRRRSRRSWPRSRRSSPPSRRS